MLLWVKGIGGSGTLTGFLSVGGRDRVQAGNAFLHLLFAAALVCEAAVGGFELPVHLVGGTGEGILDVRGFVGGDEGLVSFGAGFEGVVYLKIFSAAYCNSMMVLASTIRPSPIMASA